VTAIFITATASDVGKTFVAASLIRHLRDMGRQVDAIKPIVEGYDPAQAAASDPGVLLAALGLPFSPEAIDRISPWRFRAAISPELAARQERRGIDVDQVLAYCETAIERRRDILLIEGIGGIMVPLDEQRTMLDVMMALRLPLILVTGSYPAAISHTLTALDSLFRRDMSVIATIVSETPGSAVPLADVVATIARYTEPVIAVPRQPPHGGPPGSVFGGLFSPKAQR
jgi:dethiobiotin synthetase